MRRSTSIFIALNILAAAINYLLYPILSRILPSAEYVDITVSLSLFTQMSTFLSSVIAVSISLTKFDKESTAHRRIATLQAVILKVFLFLATGFLLASPFVMQWANTPAWFAVPITSMMLFSIPVTIISGYFNGKNLIIQLGFVTALSAVLQFGFALFAALLFHNGFITMVSMSIAQIVTLTTIHLVFRNSQLPKTSPKAVLDIKIRSPETYRLIRYTVASGVAVLAISLVQLLDLVTAQRLAEVNIKQYTDLYILGRVIFFAGMMLVWPFLGGINIKQLHANLKPLLKLTAFFVSLLVAMIGLLWVASEPLTQVMFGVAYTFDSVGVIVFLSMIYKVLLLILTVIILYFIVIRNASAVWLSVIVSASLFIASWVVPSSTSIAQLLLILNLIASVATVVGVAQVLRVSLTLPNRP